MICAFGALALAAPAQGATTRSSTRTQIAQAVVPFGDSCAVVVNLSEVTRRQLGAGASTSEPSATLRVDHFCSDGMGSGSAVLAPDEYAFGPGTAHVHASVGNWQVAFAWTAIAKPQTSVLIIDGGRTIARDAQAAVAGAVTDGVTTAEGAAALMADVVSLHTPPAGS